MKKFSLRATVAACAIALTAGFASASTVNFDFTSGGDVTANTGNSVTAVSDGITVTVTGAAFSGGLGGSGWWGDATAWSNGIGLHSYRGDAHYVDGYYDEYLLLTFSTAVDIEKLRFSYADHGDDWRVYSGNFSDNLFEDSGYLANGSFYQLASVDSETFSTQFLIGTKLSHSEWKLAGIHVAPIPLPAAGWLLLAGLGGLVALKRRRQIAA